MTAAILVWEFDRAPEEYQKIASQGGDEDWLVFVPDGALSAADWQPTWLDAIDVMREPKKFAVPGGTLYVGTHA